MNDAERRAALDAIAREVAGCTACRLHQGRTRAVPGEGTEATEVMFVGEGPGQNEDLQGRPFVGRAGDLLVKLLGSIGWSRGEVFITNVVKCRPPGNRDPEPDEIAACAPFLARQIEVLDPALVVTLGRFSMARFRPGARITQVHGTFVPADAASGAPDALTFSMYHPAAALRQASLESTMYQDMDGVPAALTAARERRAARPAVQAVEATAPEESMADRTVPEAGSGVRAAAAEQVPVPEAAVVAEAAPTGPATESEPEPVPPARMLSAEPAAEPVTAGGEPLDQAQEAASEPPPATESIEPAGPSPIPGDGEAKDSNPAAQLSLF